MSDWETENNTEIGDFFLRPVSDAHSTNGRHGSNSLTTIQAPPKKELKSEMTVLRLSEESQKMTMDSLYQIYGENFKFDDPSNYKDRGGGAKRAYWEDRGQLQVQSVTNFSKLNHGGGSDDPKDRMRRFALLKMESYGFPLTHCIEAYDHCEQNTDEALELLFKQYMRVPDTPELSHYFYEEVIKDEDLKAGLQDEKLSLESIYDETFEEKEPNKLWSLKFQIEHLLRLSPSTERKKKAEQEAAKKAAQAAAVEAKKKEVRLCRNYERNGECAYGNNCRFKHIKKQPVTEQHASNGRATKGSGGGLDENDNENWFYLEIRFPENSKYPYEAPYVFLKTTCHDIPHEILLRITRRLYREAQTNCSEGMHCIFTLSEMLQMDEVMAANIAKDCEPFINPAKSIFESQNADKSNGESFDEIKVRPTHYERGQTVNDFIKKKDPKQIKADNWRMVKKFLDKQSDEQYRKMMGCRKNLPAFQKMTDILDLMEKSQVIVISGETGCGKSTQVPQFILDNWLYQASQRDDNGESMKNIDIICTQPRRISTIGVAQRVAEERAESVGQTVGYQIRLENKLSNLTRLTFCTTGILLRRLCSDAYLESVTHIIIDEVHERNEESDFLLMILRGILKKRRDLKVILMSATMNAALFSKYFDDAPVLNIPGRTFPVEQLFLEDILELCDFVMESDSQYSRKVKKREEEQLMQEMEYADVKAEKEVPSNNIKDENLTLSALYARYDGYSKKTCKSLFLMEPMKINPELIESILNYIVNGDHKWPRTGSILVFLPGLQEIQTVHDALCDSPIFAPKKGQYVLIPLHSSLSSEEQAAVFKPAPKNKRKIVLTTNIAETSVTIDDCVFVIDSGQMKEKHFDANRNMESLELSWVSRANANQRKGRAGRVLPGVCIHLFTSFRFHYHTLAQPIPEILRTPLERVILRVKLLPNFEGKNLTEVIGLLLEPPTEENILLAIGRLENIGALDTEQNLTPLGHHLSALPVDVRIGKLMLFGAIFQCLDSVLTIAACVANQNPFVSPFNKREEARARKREYAIWNSDQLTNLNAYRKWLEVSRRSQYASRSYCDQHFLSLRTLQTIADVKYQYLELLISIGFVPINLPRRTKRGEDFILEITGQDLNQNTNNNALIISLLCGAFYPNIAKVLTPERSYMPTVNGAIPRPLFAKDLRFKTKTDGYVAIHPGSVNGDTATFQSPFLIYQEKFKTSRLFIVETSMLPILPMVIFSGRSSLKIELHGGDFCFSLEDGWIIIKAQSHEVAEMIQCLRNELMKLLEEKIKDPCLNLLHHENGRKIIQNIVYLITKNN